MALKDCTFFVNINGRQVEMDFDGFRAYLMQDGMMATLAPDLTRKRGKSVGFTITAQKAEAPTARAEAAPVKAEAPTAKAEAPTAKTEAEPSELELSVKNLRKLMPKLTKARAEAIVALLKAMGIPFDRIKLAKGRLEGEGTLQQTPPATQEDKEYFQALEEGRNLHAANIVARAAARNGYILERVYHGTKRHFWVFDAKRGRKIDVRDAVRTPQFFSFDKRFAEEYPDAVQRSDKPTRLIQAYLKYDKLWDFRVASDVATAIENSGLSAKELARLEAGSWRTIESPAFQQWLQDNGYDAYTTSEGGAVNIAVYSPEQIKLADTVVKNRAGKVIPPSQRFNPQQTDIRYQEEASPLGSIEFLDDLNALISVFEKANFSTVLHEGFHFYRRHMLNVANGFTVEEIQRFERWAGAKNGKWTVAAEEKAARAWEKYLRDGKAPTPELRELFRRISRWMKEVYETLKGSPVDIDIPPDIRAVFDRIFTLEAERQGQTPPTTLQQADFTPTSAVVEAAKKWAGVSGVTPSLSEEQRKASTAVYQAHQKRLVPIVEEYNALTRQMRETMETQSLETLAQAVPEGQMFLQGAKNLAGGAEDTAKAQLIDYLIDSLDDQLFDWVLEHLAKYTGVPVAQWRQRDTLRQRFNEPDEAAVAKLNRAESPQALLENKNRFATGKPFLVQVYHGTSGAGIAGHQFASEFGGAATGAASAAKGYFFAGSQITSLSYAMAAVPERSRLAVPQVLQFFVKMQNPLVFDMKGSKYREETYNSILERARQQGRDGVVILNTYDGGPLDNIFVVLHGNENQIKSADPTTYDDNGKAIPLSKRFESTPDIRYQKEGEGVPEAETASAAYRRAMQERQREKAAKAMQQLRSGNKPPAYTPATPRPALEITPVNRRAVIEAMQELRSFKKGLERRGVDITNASEADLDKWEKLLNHVEQLGKVNPITPQMDAAFAKAMQQDATSVRVTTLLEEAAKKAFGISTFVSGGTHNRQVTTLTAKQLPGQARESDKDRRLLAEAIVRSDISTAEVGRAQAVILQVRRQVLGKKYSDDAVRRAWLQNLRNYLTGNLKGFSVAQQQELEQYVQEIIAQMRPFEDVGTVQAANVFKTGQPVLVSVYRGGELHGDEFSEKFLGAYTRARSAKMGYFFAGRSETSAAYSPNINRYVIAMYNPFVFDYKGKKERVVLLYKVISDAVANGHDGVIAINIYDPAPIDNVFIIPPGGENRIKSYEPTLNSKGEPVPLSERFNPTTKNVFYQGEDPLPNPEGTSTEAYRRKQAQQRQAALLKAMGRLKEQEGATTTATPKEAPAKEAAPKQAAPKPTGQPSASRQATSRPTRASQPRAKKTIAERYADMVTRLSEPRKEEAQATPEELAEAAVLKLLRQMERRLKLAKQQGVDLDAMEIEGQIASRKKEFLEAADAFQDAFVAQDAAKMQKADERMRKTIESIPVTPPPKKPKPAPTMAERYAKMVDALNKPEKPAKASTPAEMAQATVNKLFRQLRNNFRIAKLQGLDVANMTVNGQTLSRQEMFVEAAEEYQDAYIKQDVPRQQAAYDRMRLAVDTIATSLMPEKKRPVWYALRSPLSYANVVGSYEGIMGKLGREISDVFKATRTAINNKEMTFSQGVDALQRTMNAVYKPMMEAQGFYGMPKIIDDHIRFLRNTAAFSAKYNRLKQEQSFFKDPKAWYTARRDFSRDIIGDQTAAFPLAAAMIQSVIYTTKLKFNIKSAATNYLSLALSVGPYMRANEIADIIAEAAKPSTWNRRLPNGRTLREMAIGETGGRQAEGATTDEGLTHWWHRGDIFQLASEHVRIAGYLVGERMVEREDQKARAAGKPPLTDAVKARLIRDWIEKVEFDNSPWNRASLFRGAVADVVFQFKPFLQKNVERFIADLRRDPEAFVLSKPNTPLGQIANTIPWKYRRVIGTLAQQVTWGGVGSLLTAVPFLKPVAGVLILAGLVNAFKAMGDDDELAEQAAIAVYYGAPAAIGIDLSSSIGFFEEPYGKTVHEQALNFFGGPAISTAANIIQKDIEFAEELQKEPKLGGEKEKQAANLRRGLNIAKQVTPYIRMLESTVDMVKEGGSTIRLDKERKLSKWQTAVRILGGSPIEQTMFFDEKEAYGWQKALMGKPTGYERLKKKEGESDASYFQRKAKTEQWERIYLPKLEQHPRYQKLTPEQQAEVRANLWRNMSEESGKSRPDTSKFNATGLLRRRAERVKVR